MADQGNEGRLSPFLRRCRMRAVRPFLRGRVLDVGCGTGLLAEWIAPNRYVGVDPDAASLALARRCNGGHRFESVLPGEEEQGRFDTIAVLAVIEHVPHLEYFMRGLVGYLADSVDASLVLTTPHPWTEGLHQLGAWGGLFSRAADDEHQALLNRDKLADLGLASGLRLAQYRRFLFGANQLAVLRRYRR